MKNAPAAYSNESALNKRKYTIGLLPERFDTMPAIVLAALLEGGQPVTAYSAYKAYGTKSLSKVIHLLEKKYYWAVERTRVKQLNMRGEEVFVIGYKLPQATLEAARELYGSVWVDLVKNFCELRDYAAKKRSVLMMKQCLCWRRDSIDPQVEEIVQKFARVLGVM
ncbi:MAG: hypothetical protein ACXWCW_31710 [Burkholderiales bacterium]